MHSVIIGQKPLSTLIAAALLMASAGHGSAQLPAFPGAEGFGSIATGGRGGDVYYVTNRNASGIGSFAYGVQNAPTAGRTIVFAVSGHIRLPSGSGGGLSISRDKITIAGQTAPGDGIAFWNNTMNLTGDDLVIRNIRWRYGKQAAGGDSVDIASSQRIILDQCDVMFSTDENLSSFGTPPEFFTFQWSVNAWGLNSHSCGGLWDINHATAHHTLWANNHTRNPKCISPSVFDWVNNVTFGWDNGFNMAASTDPIARVNIRGSYFIHGGNTTEAVYGGGLNTLGDNIFKLHMNDSALDGSANGILDVTRTNYGMVSSSSYDQTATAWPQTLDGVTGGSVIGTPVTLDPRRTAHKKVLSKAGATRMEIGTRPLRDEITQLCIDRTAATQRGIISDPLELNLSTGTAFADLQSAAAPADTDLDGMPDDWEDAVGYNKTVANNNAVLTGPETAASFFPAGTPAGYTQLEEYLHFKAVPHGTVAKNTAASPSSIEIDLRKYTSGFTASPVFTLSNITGGTLTQSGPGNAIATFTPTQNFSGRGGFLFTVTDSTGDTWTQPCALLVSTKTQPRPVTWVGDGVTNHWDTTTLNFTSILGATAFANGDAVTLNDSGSNTPTLKVIGTLAPGALSISNTTKNFTLAGTGSIAATGPFSKSGPGTLTISNTGPNIFTTASLDAGTLSLTTANALGTAPITCTAGTLALSADPSNALLIDGTVAINPSGSRTLSGAWSGSGTIQLTNTGSNLLTLGGSMATFTGDLSLGASTGTVRLYGNTGSSSAAFDLGSSTVTLFTRNGGSPFNLGSLSGGSGTTLSGASSTTAVTQYVIGALGTSTTFHGRITNGSQGSTAVAKNGSATLTLTHPNNTYSGSTTVNSGSLELLGNLTASPVTLAADATLSGTGTLGSSLTTAAAGIISPGASNGASSGTLTAASLNLVSPTLRFDLSNNPTTGNDRIHSTGAVSLSGNIHFVFNLTNGVLTPGTYDLITAPSGPVTANGVTFTSNLPTGSRQTLTLEHHATGVRLVVAGTNANLTWTGANGGLWDQQTTPAWSGASPATFFNLDHVSFTDTASSGNVSITQPVAPQSLTVSNSTALNYSFAGAPITGSTSLVKSGTGSLTLNIPQYTLANCTLTTGSPNLTVSSTANLLPGMTVTGTGIPTGTTLLSINSASSLTLSQNATASSTTTSLIFETRHSYAGGTFLNGGSLILTSNAAPTSGTIPAPANPYGLGTGPITFNGGSLTLHGHTGNLSAIHGALPNDLIIPAGQTGQIFDTVRGFNTVPYASLTGSLTGSGTLDLTVNYYRSAITGDWSAFSGIIQAKRPLTGASDPRIQFGSGSGLPLATLNLEQVRLEFTATTPAGGVVIPIGSLSGISTSVLSGSQNDIDPVIWRVGALNASTTFGGSFTPFSGGGPIGLEKTGTGTWTLTGTGTVNAGITVEQGTLSYGDASTDTLSGTGDITVDPGATLQLNSGATLTAASCEVFTSATLRGRGTLQAPLTSSGTVAIIGGTLAILGDTNLSGTLDFSSLSDRLTITGNLDLGCELKLPSTGLSLGRKLLATHTGSLISANPSIANVPAAFLARLDTATLGEVAVRLIDNAAYQNWQIANFGNTSNPDGQPSSDPDGDGITNFEEYENGTNPNGHLPLVLTISSNDAAGNFSSLHSTYSSGTLNWTNSGTLTNRSVNRLILDSSLSGGIIDMGLPTNILTLTTGEIQFLGTNNLTLTGGQIGTTGSAVSLATAGNNTLTLASPISSGAGSLSISGTAGVVLNSANTFTGGLTLNGGSLKQGVANALGSPNGTLTLNSGTLDLNGIATGFGNLTGSGGSITSPTATTLTFGNNNATGGNFVGSIQGPISLARPTSVYTASATLSGASTYTGTTTLASNSGTLVVSHSSALGNTSGVSIAGGGSALRLAHAVTLPSLPLTLRGTGANNGLVGNFNGGLTTADNASSAWSGSITLADSNARIGTGNDGTLSVSGPILGSGANQSLSISAGIGTSTGTVILSGANNFTGNLSIVRGTLRLGASNTLPSSAILDVASASVTENTTFDLNGFSQTLAGIRRTSASAGQVSRITNSSTTSAILSLLQSSNLSFSGRLSGNLILRKAGAGTLTLTSSVQIDPTVALRLDAGTLSLAASHTIASLQINGIWMPPGTYQTSNSTGRISGAGSLVVTGSGPPAYATWISGFPSIPANQSTPSADPDLDGHTNLEEFAFGGNPSSATDAGNRQVQTTDVDLNGRGDLTLTLEIRNGAAFISEGPSLVADIDGVTYRIEGSANLQSFNTPVAEVIPSLPHGVASPGYSARSFRLLVPVGLSGAGFIRASASIP